MNRIYPGRYLRLPYPARGLYTFFNVYNASPRNTISVEKLVSFLFATPIIILAIDNEEDRLFVQQLYEDYYPLMLRRARNLLRNSRDAEDAVNDSIISLINHINTIRGLDVCKLRGYVVSTIMNTCRDHLKKLNRRNNREVYEAEDILENMQSQNPDVSDGLIREANIQTLMTCLKRLPDRQRDLLEMKYMLDYPNEEIAEHLGIKPASIRQSLTNARRKLACILAAVADEGMCL